jgi:hypothetical protein
VVYVFKAVLHLNLFFELWKPEITDNMERSPTENSLVLVISIFGLILLLNIASIFIQLFRRFKKSLCPRSVGVREATAELRPIEHMRTEYQENSLNVNASQYNNR